MNFLRTPLPRDKADTLLLLASAVLVPSSTCTMPKKPIGLPRSIPW